MSNKLVRMSRHKPFSMYHFKCTISDVPFQMYHFRCTISDVPFQMYHYRCTMLFGARVSVKVAVTVRPRVGIRVVVRVGLTVRVNVRVRVSGVQLKADDLTDPRAYHCLYP